MIYIIIFLIILAIYGIYIYTRINKFDEKPIIFYHPIIRQKYCKIIILLQYKPEMKIVLEKLIIENNRLLKNYPYIDMINRLDEINKNHKIQTIFNLIDI
jgi:hypothetical protein